MHSIGDLDHGIFSFLFSLGIKGPIAFAASCQPAVDRYLHDRQLRAGAAPRLLSIPQEFCGIFTLARAGAVDFRGYSFIVNNP